MSASTPAIYPDTNHPKTKKRWIDNYYTMRDHMLWSIPYPIRVIIGLLAHRKLSAMLHGQGTSGVTDEEPNWSKQDIWGIIAGLLRASKTEPHGRGG